MPSTTITTHDGRLFPAYDGEALAWDVGLYMSLNEEQAGYPRARAVVKAMREHRPDQLRYYRADVEKAVAQGRHNLFVGNARRALAFLDDVDAND